MSEAAWRPIETAPKDGTIIIGMGEYSAGVKMIAAAMKGNHYGWWRDNDGNGFTVSCYPTHWMPLPEFIMRPTETYRLEYSK